MSRFRPSSSSSSTTTTIRRREVISDDDDIFGSPFKTRPVTEHTTVRRRITPGGGVITTTTTTSAPRTRLHRAIESLGDSFDDDSFFSRTGSATNYTTTSHPVYSRQPSEAEEFKVQFEVGEFKSSEIEVKTRNGVVHVTAKRAGGTISKEFNQRCQIPDGVDPLMIRASLSPLGILTIKAPRNPSKSRYTGMYERNIPVRMGIM